jgi:hypothetical protein
MHEHNATPPQAVPVPPYWVMALSYAILYFVLGFACGWIWDTIAGDPFYVGETSRTIGLAAVFFGLVMAWLVPRLRRRR